MDTKKTAVFSANTDLAIREKLRKFYYDIVYKYNFSHSVRIKISDMKWLSANSLNLILVFIELILSKRPNGRIYIDLFPERMVETILRSHKIRQGTKTYYYIKQEKLSSLTIDRYRSKIRFYETINFTKHLFDYGLSISPGPKTYNKLKNHIDASPEERHWRHSSRMLGLNKLIENELEQRTLSDRVGTMASILYKNLFGRISPEEAREDSEQIMFELVKNIYQHSGTPENIKFKNSGFGCAQIIPSPLLNNPKVDENLLKDILYKEWKTVRKKWEFLSITINDFGVGLARKIKSDLLNRKNLKEVSNGEIDICDPFLENDCELMLLGVITDYTTKQHGFDENFLEKPLESKGYGYIFCMSFIAKNFGRMEIRSGKSKLLFVAKPDAYFCDAWNNSSKAAEVLDRHFHDFFEIHNTLLSSEEGQFPGTQILIEIPVEVFS